MTARQYAVIDPAKLGALLFLERAGTVLTHDAAASVARKAIALDGKTSGRWGAEWYVWGDGAIANAVSVGLARPGSALTAYVGGDVDSYGYRVAEGEFHTNGASTASVTAGAVGQWIGLVLDLTDAAAPAVAWYLGGVLLGSVTLPDAGPWHLAATVSGADQYGLRLLQNAGQRAFENLPAGVRGWFAERESVGVLRIAETGFVTGAGDETPFVRYRGLLGDDSRLSLRQRLHFWPMGPGSSSGGSGGTLRLANADGALDYLLSTDARNATVRLREIPEGGGVGDAVDVAQLVLDDSSNPDDGSVDLAMSDPVTELDAALQRRLMPPDADPSSADTVFPITLGAGRSVTPKLLNGPDLTYVLHDGLVSTLGTVRDGGYPLDPLADPVDYTLDGRGYLILERDPVFAITVDLGVDGTGYVPPSSTDVVDGDGDPFAGSGWAITGWTGGVFGTEPDTAPSYAGDGRVSFPNLGTGSNCYIEHDTGETVAGETYRITLTIFDAYKPDEFAPPAFLAVGRSLSQFDDLVRVEINYYSTFPQTVEVEIVATSAHPIFVTYRSHQTAGGSCVVEVVRVVLLPRVDVSDDDEIPALTLEAMLRELIVVRGGVSEDRIVLADAAAIDAETGYAGTGLHISEPTQVRPAVQALLDSYCACLWRDRSGRIRVARMRRPDAADALGTIRKGAMLADIRVRPYRAEGLTTQAKARRNWSPLVEGQMTSDTLDVPPALRARLIADHRINVASGVSVASAYAHASYAPPQSFLLDLRADAQLEVDYVAGIHGDLLRYFVISLPYSLDYDLDQTWLIDYTDDDGRPARYGLDAVPAIIHEIDADPLQRTLTLTLLG